MFDDSKKKMIAHSVLHKIVKNATEDTITKIDIK